MPKSPKRRRLLQYLAAVGLTGLAGCAESKETASSTTTSSNTKTRTESGTTTEQTTSEQQWEIDPLEHDKLIGAHYYPWHTENYWETTPSVGEPVLGEYLTKNTDVINQHIKWAREHGINWFNVSWKPNEFREENLNEGFLEANLADQIKFSLLYESIGSAVLFGNPSEAYSITETRNDVYRIDFDQSENRETLISHFKRLENHYFDKSNYLRINGRPVVYVYAAHGVKGSAEKAYREAKNAIESEPYLIGSVLASQDHLYQDWVTEYDAITEYGLYNATIAESGGYEEYLKYAERVTKQRALISDYLGLDYIPDIMPGYDDTAQPDRDNVPIHRDPEGFRVLCDIALDSVDSDLNALLITSFNEWPEYTAIEPGKAFGTTYLEIVGEKLANVSKDKSESLDPDNYDVLQLDFNQTIRPEGSVRDLALVGKNISLVGPHGSLITEYNIGIPNQEPYLIEGAYNLENTDWGRFRWFGGPTARATIYFGPDLATPASVEWTGLPMRDNEIEADIYFNEQHTDHVAFGKREMTTYQFSLSV